MTQDGNEPGAQSQGFLSHAARIAGWLIVARLDRKPSLIWSLVVTVAVTFVGLTLNSAHLKIPPNSSTYDLHAFLSMELATNWVYCGRYSTHSTTYDLSHYLVVHNAEIRELPMPTVLERLAGSRDKYCSAVTEPFLNNENSLFYIDSALLRIRPDVTLGGLGVLLIWLRVAGIVFLVFALVSIGASPVFALFTLMIGVEIAGIVAETHLYSAYPFLLPFLGTYAALLALTLRFSWQKSNWRLALAALAIGLFAGLFYNLRSSYLPSIVGCYLVFVVFIFFEGTGWELSRTSGRWKLAAIALAGFIVGGGLFYLTFTRPLGRTGLTFNRSYHVVAHPLVLGLAVPQNDLAKREGIVWSDPVGLDLARRVDPNASYLGPTYEQALMTYYSGLWRRHPREMVRIYLAKWRLSTSDSAWYVDSHMGSLAKRVLGPTRYLRSGISFTLCLLLVALTAIYIGVKYSPAAGILVATFAGTGFVITLESAIIMPFFYVQYQNAQLGVLFLINLVFYQMVVNAASGMFTGNAHVQAQSSNSGKSKDRMTTDPREESVIQRDGQRSQTHQTPLVSIVTPFYNEGQTLAELLRRMVSTTNGLKDLYEFEFVFVDDGSRDDSLQIARDLAISEPRLSVIQLRRNYGQTAALQAGLDAASGAIIITMDADLQHFPEEMPAFLEKIDQGYDVVCGWRHQRQEGLIRRWPSQAANYPLRQVSGLSIHDIGTTYRAYRREIIADMRLLGESHRYVPVYAKVVGARIDEIPIKNIERPFGTSNYGLARTINVLLDIFFIFFFVRYLDRPIRIFGKIALLAFSLGSVIAGALLLEWLRTGAPVVRERSGWFTLSVTSLLASVQFFLAGILGEMVTRVYFSSNRATTYKIRKVWSKDAAARELGTLS